MTACVNRKHTKKVAAVVTASLVGALSLGAAPVAAMADTADTGIDLQALSANDAFAEGTLTGAKDQQGRTLDIPADGIVLVEQGKWMVPSEVTVKHGEAVKLTNANASFTYTRLEDGATITNPTDSNASFFADAGRYTVAVRMIGADNPYLGARTFTATFIVEKGASIADATVFDNSDGEENVSDTTFTFNGKPQEIGLVADGKVIPDSTYTTTWTPVSGEAEATHTESGTYQVQVEDNATGEKKTFTVNVGKLNLSNANITVSDQDAPFSGTLDPNSILAGEDVIDSYVNVSLTYSDGVGAASAYITSNDNSVTGSATVSFNVVENVLSVSDFIYDNHDFSVDEVVNKFDGDSFRANKLSVRYGGTSINSAYYTVTYTDADGNEVEASALQNPGTYYVSVRVNAAASHYMYGSNTQTMKVTVIGGTIDSSDVVFKYDGVVGSVFNDIDFSGENVLEKLESAVYANVGQLTEGEDYTLKVVNDKTGDEVEEIVDAGNYTVSIELIGDYTLTSGTTDADLECHITVNPLTLSELNVGGDAITAYTYKDATTGSMVTTWYLGYTGEDIEPALEFGYYTDKDGEVQAYDASKADELTWHALPEGAVTVTGYEYCDDDAFSPSTAKEVESISAKGTYKVMFALESGNYQFDSRADDDLTENYITVSDSRVAFADVPADAWYAQSVFQAKQLDYVSGISGTNLFAPENSITRADALVIISRMAGADVAFGDDWMSQNISWITRYSDVDSGAYYAKAVAWATKVGIVHGYGDGTFQPNKYITREEFAVMLANYAKAMGDFDATDGSALDGMSDASTVSDWAEESVAWAVENEVMGNGGFIAAQNDISRAEVAAMAVNYQPEGASEDVIG